MSGHDHRKKSIYIPEDMARELEEQAERLDRSESWLIQRAWTVAREKIRKLPRQELTT